MDVKQMSYEEWLKFYGIKEEWVDCEDCRGTGIYTCEFCGSEVDCESCDGRGETNASREEYDKIKFYEKKRLEKIFNKLEEKR